MPLNPIFATASTNK